MEVIGSGRAGWKSPLALAKLPPPSHTLPITALKLVFLLDIQRFNKPLRSIVNSP